MSDILFSLLLNGYVEILAAVEKRSIKSGDEGDVSPLRPKSYFHPNIQTSKHTSFPPGTPVIDTTATKVLIFFIFNMLLCAADCWIFVKVPKLSLGSWSKALLKAREAQTILVEPDLVSEDTWENDSRRGMHALNERCEGEISPGFTFIDIDPVVSDI